MCPCRRARSGLKRQRQWGTDGRASLLGLVSEGSPLLRRASPLLAFDRDAIGEPPPGADRVG
jgi:hypothetical protein